MSSFYGFLFISIVGSILHFTYDLSKHNKYAGILSAVNESVWEHMKLLVFPSLVWLLIEVPFIGDNPNFLTAKAVSLITMVLLVPTLFYLIKYLFKKSYLIIDILIFYIAVGIGQYLASIILNLEALPKVFNYFSLVLLICLYGYFLIATILPGEGDIYIDPNTNKKGIEGHRLLKKK